MLVDGVSVITLLSPPFFFNAPSSLVSGGHHVEVRATDVNGTPGAASVDVLIGEACDRPSDCASLGEHYTCVGGRCVTGPGSPGGLGEPCDAPSDCDSGVCGSKGGENHCAEACVLGASDCPSGFACENAGADTGLCWPSVEGGCMGCASSSQGGPPIAPVGIGIVLAAVCLRRRRRSAT